MTAIDNTAERAERPKRAAARDRRRKAEAEAAAASAPTVNAEVPAAPELFSDPPQGSIWAAAAAERHWLLWRYKKPKRRVGKPSKVPMRGDVTSTVALIRTPGSVSAEEAATLTLEEAVDKARRFNASEGTTYGAVGGFGVGYLARAGSALVTVDIDNCRDPETGEIRGDAAAVAESLIVTTYVEPSVSGTGLRAVLARGDCPEELLADVKFPDGSGIGLYAAGTRFATIGGTGGIEVSGISDDADAVRWVRQAWARAGGKSESGGKGQTGRRGRRARPEDDGRWAGHWLEQLPPERQEAAFGAMLAALEGTSHHNDYDAWMKITFACHDLSERVGWDVRRTWDRWCARGAGYDTVGNDQKWRGAGRDSIFRAADSARVTVFTLIHLAEEHAFDRVPWVREASAPRSLADAPEGVMAKLRALPVPERVAAAMDVIARGPAAAREHREAQALERDPGAILSTERLTQPGRRRLASVLSLLEEGEERDGATFGLRLNGTAVLLEDGTQAMATFRWNGGSDPVLEGIGANTMDLHARYADADAHRIASDFMDGRPRPNGAAERRRLARMAGLLAGDGREALLAEHKHRDWGIKALRTEAAAYGTKLEEALRARQRAAGNAAAEAAGVNTDLAGTLVWHAPTGRVFDLAGPPAMPLHTKDGLAVKFLPFPDIDSRGNPVDRFKRWLADPQKWVTHTAPVLDPRKEPGFAPNGDGTGVINRYRPFQPVETNENAYWFLRVLKHVFPEPGDARWALQWMATKARRPWERMTALISATPTFGTGRNTLMRILRAVLGGDGQCLHLDADRLFGAQASQFNGHLDNLLITFSEAEAGKDGDPRAMDKAMVRLRELIDPDEGSVTIERKGVDGAPVTVFTSYFGATNGLVPTTRGDRRMSILGGNRQPLVERWPLARHPGLRHFLDQAKGNDPEMLSAVHGLLMRVDLTGFAPSVPRDTAAKAVMAEACKAPLDLLIEDTLEELGTAVFTTAGLMEQWYEIIDEVPAAIRGRAQADISRQLQGWSRKHTRKPDWLDNAQGTTRINGASVRPRVLNTDTEHGLAQHAVADKVELAYFLAMVSPVASAAERHSLAVRCLVPAVDGERWNEFRAILKGAMAHA